MAAPVRYSYRCADICSEVARPERLKPRHIAVSGLRILCLHVAGQLECKKPPRLLILRRGSGVAVLPATFIFQSALIPPWFAASCADHPTGRPKRRWRDMRALCAGRFDARQRRFPCAIVWCNFNTAIAFRVKSITCACYAAPSSDSPGAASRPDPWRTAASSPPPCLVLSSCRCLDTTCSACPTAWACH